MQERAQMANGALATRGQVAHMSHEDAAERLAQAQPRLRRLIHLHHIPLDAAEDVLQETLLTAWRSLDQLRDPACCGAWLDGICRNMCLRQRRACGVLSARETYWDVGSADDDSLAALIDPVDPDTFDPLEDLTRQDMAVLLDRALGLLAPDSRALVEAYYLAEMPQRAIAERMGMTLSALESRLRRTRQQLWRILHQDLRVEALALGLVLEPTTATAWRETRLYCPFCGQHRLRGTFDPLPDGHINMRLWCPACQPGEVISTDGFLMLSRARSFLPAVKRCAEAYGRFYTATLADGGRMRCWLCGQPTHLHVMRAAVPPIAFASATWLEWQCDCGLARSSVWSRYSHLPVVRDFLFGQLRCQIAPEAEMEYQGQPVARFRLASRATGQHLDVFAHPETLHPVEIVVS